MRIRPETKDPARLRSGLVLIAVVSVAHRGAPSTGPRGADERPSAGGRSSAGGVDASQDVRSAPAPLRSITVGTMIQDTLVPEDFRDERGGPSHRFTVLLTAGRTVTLVARGVSPRGLPGHGRPPLDPTLTLFENGAVVARDEGAFRSALARIVFVPRRTGVHVVQVGAYGGARWGGYTLEVSAAGSRSR